VSKLKVGLKCGGSDGFSGITANPLIGQFSDMLIAAGGSTVLTEVPEMFGAETILMDRCVDEAVFEKTVHLINDFKDYFIRHNQEIYENPSPGNKAGGITTLEEKSLGCTQKGGRAAVVDVLTYGDRVTKNGLNLLNGPGNDMVAVTNLVAAGCHMVLFSTGRGTPLGSPVPTVKIATNDTLAETKNNWIDFNAGPMLAGTDLAEEFMRYIIRVVNGEETCNERNGYREIAIFKDGVTL
ncbi:MAG: UxaA family hydrolase, partial [Lachnospiraceae bacterium]|nr:UxaA family hydrolase [Lachnospiraceae bacterium]